MTDEPPQMHPLLIEMRGLRAEMGAMREQFEMLFKRQGQILTELRDFRSETDKVLRNIGGDVLLLENQQTSPGTTRSCSSWPASTNRPSHDERASG